MSGDRRVRWQLTFFAVLSTITMSVVALQYAQLPQLVGWGRYEVSTILPRTGGLSDISLVTYRGVEIGKVTGLDLVPGGGVVVRYSVDRSAKVPADVVARVHSMTAIGEQYLDLVPKSPSGTGERTGSTGDLQAGAAVPADPVQPVPVEAGALLAHANDLISSVDPKTLSTTVNEVSDAFSGRGDDIGTLIDSGSNLISTASANLDATKALLRDLGPVLGTQIAAGPQLVQTAENLDVLSGALADSDGDLRAIIAQGPAVAGQLSQVVRGVNPTLPMVLANLGTTGQVLSVYDAGLRQILVLLPATYAQLLSTGAGQGRLGGRLLFRLNIQDPAACREGFTSPHRDPSDVSVPSSIPDSYCKAPGNSQLAVRGARNSPCPNGAGRSATAAGCGLRFAAPTQVSTTTYDARTGDYVSRDGTHYRINDPDAGQSAEAANFLVALSG